MSGKHDKSPDDEQAAKLLLTGPIVIRGLGRSVKDALRPGRPSRHRAFIAEGGEEATGGSRDDVAPTPIQQMLAAGPTAPDDGPSSELADAPDTQEPDEGDAPFPSESPVAQTGPADGPGEDRVDDRPADDAPPEDSAEPNSPTGDAPEHEPDAVEAAAEAEGYDDAEAHAFVDAAEIEAATPVEDEQAEEPAVDFGAEPEQSEPVIDFGGPSDEPEPDAPSDEAEVTDAEPLAESFESGEQAPTEEDVTEAEERIELVAETDPDIASAELSDPEAVDQEQAAEPHPEPEAVLAEPADAEPDFSESEPDFVDQEFLAESDPEAVSGESDDANAEPESESVAESFEPNFVDQEFLSESEPEAASRESAEAGPDSVEPEPDFVDQEQAVEPDSDTVSEDVEQRAPEDGTTASAEPEGGAASETSGDALDDFFVEPSEPEAEASSDGDESDAELHAEVFEPTFDEAAQPQGEPDAQTEDGEEPRPEEQLSDDATPAPEDHPADETAAEGETEQPQTEAVLAEFLGEREWTTAEELFSRPITLPTAEDGLEAQPAAETEPADEAEEPAETDAEQREPAAADVQADESAPEPAVADVHADEPEPEPAAAAAIAAPAAAAAASRPAPKPERASRPPRRARPARARVGREAIGIAVLVVLALVCGGLITAVVLKTQKDAATAAQEAANYTPPPLATPSPTATGPVVAVIGDGTTSSAASGVTAANRWSALLETALSGTVTTDAASGMGYAAKSSAGETFVTAAGKVPSNAQVVVFFGGASDANVAPLSLAKSATDAFSAAATQAPKAKLIVIGPAITAGVSSADLTPIRNSLRSSARIAKATWIDPIDDNWLSASKQSATSATSLTASDEKTLSTKIEAAIKKALG